MTSTCNYPSFPCHIQVAYHGNTYEQLVTTLHFHVTYKENNLIYYRQYLVTTLHFHVTYKSFHKWNIKMVLVTTLHFHVTYKE